MYQTILDIKLKWRTAWEERPCFFPGTFTIQRAKGAACRAGLSGVHGRLGNQPLLLLPNLHINLQKENKGPRTHPFLAAGKKKKTNNANISFKKLNSSESKHYVPSLESPSPPVLCPVNSSYLQGAQGPSLPACSSQTWARTLPPTGTTLIHCGAMGKVELHRKRPLGKLVAPSREDMRT